MMGLAIVKPNLGGGGVVGSTELGIGLVKYPQMV